MHPDFFDNLTSEQKKKLCITYENALANMANANSSLITFLMQFDVDRIPELIKIELQKWCDVQNEIIANGARETNLILGKKNHSIN